MSKQLLNTYTNTQKDSESIREIEARALLNCASKLRQAQEQVENYDLYIEAIKTTSGYGRYSRSVSASLKISWRAISRSRC
ncbi:MAG: hypothetical protein WDO70_07225 [Alphaproteobacteria bacterium]